MKLIYVCLLFVTLHIASATEVGTDHKWSKFLSSFRVSIDSEEEHNLRKSLFLTTDAMIERHNADNNHSFKLIHNEFSTMTDEEKQRFLGQTKATKVVFDKGQRATTKVNERVLPTNYDLRSATTCGRKIPVKDQNTCGSCWAFSAIAPIEYAKCVQSGGTYTTLSEQQFVSCDTIDGGCKGGNVYNAYNWLMSAKNGAVATSASYPYVSRSLYQPTCKTTGVITGATVKTWKMLRCAAIGGTASVTTDIMNTIYTYGVVANCLLVAGDNFYQYRDGVLSDPQCSTFSGCGPSAPTNHCTSIVGWGTDPTSKKDYWILRNQWGTSWGNGGYMLIQKGVNMCGVESQIYYATSVA